MLKTNFLHIAVTVILISIYPWLEGLSFAIQLQITLLLIFFLGIPHGAIDHLLLYRKQKQKLLPNTNFYVFYLGLIATYTVLWILMPYFSLCIFFLISFYHFGQSQFSFVKLREKSLLKVVLYLAWGGSIIGGLFYYHYEALISFFNETEHFALTSTIITSKSLFHFFIGSSALALMCMVYTLLFLEKDNKAFLREIGVFALLHLAFFTIPPLIAFALYFGFWHSLKVLNEEYQFMASKRNIHSVKEFIKLLLPFSLVSIVGVIILLTAFSIYEFAISPFFLTIIFLSVLTLPHSVIMMNWYRLTSKN